MSDFNTTTSAVLDPWTRNTVQAGQDPNSVYYIHPSDANTIQLVTMKFNGVDFSN